MAHTQSVFYVNVLVNGVISVHFLSFDPDNSTVASHQPLPIQRINDLGHPPPPASTFGWRSGWERVDLVRGGLGRAAPASNSVAAAIEAVTRGRDPE